MRPPTIEDDELLDRLLAVFRQHGYEGSSLSLISVATGLKRASLYHRFPGGKEQIAEAVLQRVATLFEQHVLAPVQEDGPVAERARGLARGLDRFYQQGSASCVFDTLSLGTGPFKDTIKKAFDSWLDAFGSLALDAGFAKAEARRRGEEALVRLQGVLVIARATGNRRPFRDFLKGLPSLLTQA